MRRYIALLMLVPALLPYPAEAHAGLVRATPVAGALLQAPPHELVLEFSEDLDPAFSKVQLFNSKNQLVTPGPGLIDPATPKVLRLALADLPQDSYAALWRARSALDGHVTQGNLPFGVGVPAPATLLPPVGAPDPALEPPPALDSMLRWLVLLATMLMLGGLPFGLLAWRPATMQSSGPLSVDMGISRMIQRLILAGGALFLLANSLFLLSQAATAANVPLSQVLGAPVVQLLGTHTGILWLARMGLAPAILALTWRLPLPGQSTWRWWSGLALGAALLLTFSLNSHGAAQERDAPLAVAIDWLHLAASVVWLGGLPPMALALSAARRTPQRDILPAALLRRFSRLALGCVALLALSGLYSAWLHIGRFELLGATTYGRALLVKIALFGLLIVVGALNLLLLSPRLRTTGERLTHAFRHTLRAELLLGAALLLVVGVMTSVAPSQAAWAEKQRQGLAEAVTVDNVQLVLRVAPAHIGDNQFAVDVTDDRPGAQQSPAQVLLRLNMVGMTMGTTEVDTETADTRRYTARGSYVAMGGRWQIEVILRRAGFNDVRHTFEADIVRAG